MTSLDALDHELIAATQGGLPLVQEPYAEIAARVGIEPEEAVSRLTRLLGSGAIRRIGVVPNHYALGYTANGMSVWDIEDHQVDEIGRRIGALTYVSHCYRRPRHPPVWRYNFFAMVHDKSRESVRAKVAEIASLVGPAARAHDVLFSVRVLKKTGLRVGAS